MSDRIIFDDAIEAIAAGAKLSESDKKILRGQLVDAVLGNHLKVFAKGSQAPYDFKSVRGALGLQSARFGKNDWDAVKTFKAEIYAVDLDEWLEQNWQKLKFRFGIITDTLFDSRLSDREFGSHLIHVPSLLNWAGPTHFPETNPQIDAYKFAQVEALLCAIERVSQSMTTEQALNIVRSQPEHQFHPAVINNNGQLARWLLGADAHMKWRKLIVAAVKTDKLELLDFASKLPISAEALRALLASLPEANPSSTDLNQAGGTQAGASESNQAGDGVKQAPVTVTDKSSEEELAALFDEVHYRELATMFPTHNDPIKSANDWQKFSMRKARNGLTVAQVSDKGGMFNPYKAARWWIDKRNPIGWDWPKCVRKLANSLPIRSKDEKHLLTGTFD